MVNEKHEIVGMLSLSDLVRKAGIEASVIATTREHSARRKTKLTARAEKIITAA